ncbi:DUF444 family protein, partial [Candidatus Woesearchaeota archaeon]|nr:DUF444 family protein [Candidatus Woesearchaeota archaeon]
MAHHIRRDHGRFSDIVRKETKKNMKKYISHHEILVPRGKDTYAVPIPRINLPRFTYGHKDVGGVGSGDGEIGTPISGSNKGIGSGAGDSSADHPIDVETSLEELSKMLAEELELPNLKNKGKKNIPFLSHKYRGIAKTGPSSLIHRKRSIKEALKRTIIEGTFVPGEALPLRKEDRRYKAPKPILIPDLKAVVFYIMDVSGSMGQPQISLVRNLAFWIDVYLRGQYPSTVNKYIVHDTVAKEVSQNIFYRTKGSGGTKLSSGILLADKMIETEFSPLEWNIYLFHFSDGDNWDGDNQRCIDGLKAMQQYVNQYAFAKVKSEVMGDFDDIIEQNFSDDENIVTANLNERDDCYD